MITLQERVHASPKPDDWQLDKLHQVFRVRRGHKNAGMKEDNLLSLSYGRIIQKNIDTADGLLPDNFEGYQIVEPGNIVLRLTDLQNDKRSLRQGLVSQRGIITSAYDAVEVQRDNDPRFWFYSLLALDLAKHYYSLGGGVRQSVKFADFPNDWVYRPDLATQRQIADFLDRETARIDLLIEKKQRLVALLGEKLASKQQSEIDDLLKAVGQSRLKNFTVSITTGPFGSAIKQDEYIEGGVPILNPAHISDGKIVPDLSVTLSEAKFRDLYYWHLIKGDLLMGRRGELGRCAVVEEDFGDGICGTGCLRLRVPPKHNSLYLQIIISSRRAREWLDLYAVGTTMKNLNEAIVGGLPVPNARREQQDEFVSEIQNARQKNAEVCSSITSSINRLKEYRSALITAAVTGQIDVQTYVKSGTTDRRLDAIQEELGA